MAFNPRNEEPIDLVEETEPEFYRGNCSECGKYIESAYCGYNEKTRTYICYGCGAMHPVDRKVNRYFVRLTHVDGRKKEGHITLGTSISNFVNLCGNHGWVVEYTPAANDSQNKEVTTGLKQAFAQ